MKKDRSNHSSSQKHDFSLPRAKILRGRKNFQRLFERDANIFRNRYVDLRCQIVDKNSFGCLMGFIVKKSLGKANKRNRMKRLLREAYRLHQYILSESLEAMQMTFHGALMAKSIDIDYTTTEQNVVALLREASEQLPTMSSGQS